jgi:hypothetical protein
MFNIICYIFLGYGIFVFFGIPVINWYGDRKKVERFDNKLQCVTESSEKAGITFILLSLLLAVGIGMAKADNLSSATSTLIPAKACASTYKLLTAKPTWSCMVATCLDSLTDAINSCETLTSTSGEDYCKQEAYDVVLNVYKTTKYLNKSTK